jgi:hypothetical protein
MIHDRTLPTLLTNIECNIRTNKKGYQNVHLWFQQTRFLKKLFFQSMVMGAKESETLISMANLGHCHLLFHPCLPKLSLNFLFLELK